MKIRAHVGMVMNLDKCIGCHTCSVTCKNVWTSREGAEYMWWNNVETKPGLGYPKSYEDQERNKGGWVRKRNGKLKPRMGGKLRILSKLFYNPDLPSIDDYYEPFTYDYEALQEAGEREAMPTGRPVSILTGESKDQVDWSANWEDDLGGPFAERGRDPNLRDVDARLLGEFEQSFMLYLPRICEHCVNPSCVAVCPSGAIYKRQEDGIVLVDQAKCRGWRMCVTGCPYKKVYYNWSTGKAEKCTFCYPRIEAGQPTICSETCVGRLRYLGVILYDADRIAAAASVEDERDLLEAHLDLILDPHDEAVAAEARAGGIPDDWIEAAQASPVYRMAKDWRIALPLHPEYRTLPMVWYVPPLSPIQAAADAGEIGFADDIPDLSQLQIPVAYLANLLAAGDEEPVVRALERMLAMRVHMRARHVEGRENASVLERVGMSADEMEAMYRLLALARAEDRYVLPTAHPETAVAPNAAQGACGFTFPSGGGPGTGGHSVFSGEKRRGGARPSDEF